MKTVKVEKRETVITLEFTEKELATIVSYYAMAGIANVVEHAKKNNFEILKAEYRTKLYDELKETLLNLN